MTFKFQLWQGFMYCTSVKDYHYLFGVLFCSQDKCLSSVAFGGLMHFFPVTRDLLVSLVILSVLCLLV